MRDNMGRIDWEEGVIGTGFVDSPMQGGAGLDVMLASQAELPRLGKFLATHGVTGYFPTTVAAPLDQTCAALERLAGATEAGTTGKNDNTALAPPLAPHV